MGRRLTVAAITLLLLLPEAGAASITVNVASQNPGCPQSCATYPNMPDTTYSFNLIPIRNGAFNLSQTGGAYVNQSLYTAKIDSQFIDPSPITSTRTYRFQVQFNGSHTISLTMQYEHHLGSILGYFNAYYSLAKDGAEVCSNTNRLINGNSITPNPHFIFDFDLRGSYNSASNGIGSTGNFNGSGGIFFSGPNANVSGELLYDNPSLAISWTDDTSLSGFGVTQLFSSNPCSFSNLWGNGYASIFIYDNDPVLGQVGVREMTSAPTLTMSTQDPAPKTHSLQWRFSNATVTLAEAAAEVQAINSGIQQENSHCEGFHLLGLCLVDFLAGLMTLVFKLASIPISIILSAIPGGENVKAFVGVAINGLVEVVTVLGSFLLLSGASFPVGGVIWSLLVWNLALGFLLWGMTGNPLHVVGLAYWFLKGYCLVVFWLTVGLFILLPIKVYELFAEAIP